MYQKDLLLKICHFFGELSLNKLPLNRFQPKAVWAPLELMQTKTEPADNRFGAFCVILLTL